MSHRRQQKENKKNKNAMDQAQILNGFLRELDQELKQLKNKIKIIKKLKGAIEWTLISQVK